jgi:hypothetical protein
MAKIHIQCHIMAKFHLASMAKLSILQSGIQLKIISHLWRQPGLSAAQWRRSYIGGGLGGYQSGGIWRISRYRLAARLAYVKRLSARGGWHQL